MGLISAEYWEICFYLRLAVASYLHIWKASNRDAGTVSTALFVV